MKFTTLLTLLFSLSVASSAKIPSRKVAAPTNPDYVVPAPSPTNDNNNANSQPTAAKVPSRNVMPPTSSSHTTARSITTPKAAPEPVRPKIMSPPVAPFPRTTIEDEDLPVLLSIPQKVEEPVVVAATVEASGGHDRGSTTASDRRTFPIPDFTEAVNEEESVSSALHQDSELAEDIVHEVVDEATAEEPEAVLANDDESKTLEVVEAEDAKIEPASAPDGLVPQLPPLITTGQEPTIAEVVVYDEPTCDNRNDEGCNNDTTTNGEGDVLGKEAILIVSVKPRRRR
jgi:hypothetical protein